MLDLGGNAGAATAKELIMQWVGVHRCTHGDIGILCHAVLSSSVWRKANQDALWPEDEPAAWTDVQRQDTRQRLYNAIERAMRPEALDWDKVYKTKQRPGEEAAKFMHRLVQAFIQYSCCKERC